VNPDELYAQVVATADLVLDVAAGKSNTGGAVALGVKRLIREPILAPRQAELPCEGVGEALLRHLGGDHTVKHIDPEAHRFEQIDRGADAHQVARATFGEQSRGVPGDRVAHLARLADREAADGEAVERMGSERLRALGAERLERASLDDGEQGLAGLPQLMGGQRAERPAVGLLHREAGGPFGGGGVDADVEHHHDLAADRLLHRDRRLRREEMTVMIVRVGEDRALLGDLPVVGQREDLIAAGVGEHAAVPAHEAVNTAQLLEYLAAGPQHQVVGVGEDQLRADGFGFVDGVEAKAGVGGHRHEDRRFHRPTAGLEQAGAGGAVGGEELKSKRARQGTCTLAKGLPTFRRAFGEREKSARRLLFSSATEMNTRRDGNRKASLRA